MLFILFKKKKFCVKLHFSQKAHAKMETNFTDLELVRDFWDEWGNLLHEPVHAALTARLQQSGDGQCGDAAVRVRDQVLQVQVACSHSWWMLHGHLVDREDMTPKRSFTAEFK